MAKGDLKVRLDFVSNLHTLVDVQCLVVNCKYRQEGSLNCNLKQLSLGANGTCMSFVKKDEA